MGCRARKTGDMAPPPANSRQRPRPSPGHQHPARGPSARARSSQKQPEAARSSQKQSNSKTHNDFVEFQGETNCVALPVALFVERIERPAAVHHVLPQMVRNHAQRALACFRRGPAAQALHITRRQTSHREEPW
eukprot:CAMPEP_0179376470 /NCGR_PEP_ID=MMETSP0797-20121207/88332_1 /TAXON_ID=47934 /ORGANISM="Dinophysis acuminata, Strain DAEP01" /LENGTH=133 /DNA_ID=CAMNT_0021092503 /DNA_START=271 /DNA_END=669 /DNA_ORIENTATION=+